MVPDVISIAKTKLVPLYEKEQEVCIIDTIGIITG